MTFLPLIGIFANVILQAVGAAGVLNPATATLISTLIGNVLPLIVNLTSGQSKLQDVLAALAGMSSIIATLKAQTNLPADRLNQLDLLQGEVTAAINAYVAAGQGYNESTYAPIATV